MNWLFWVLIPGGLRIWLNRFWLTGLNNSWDGFLEADFDEFGLEVFEDGGKLPKLLITAGEHESWTCICPVWAILSGTHSYLLLSLLVHSTVAPGEPTQAITSWLSSLVQLAVPSPLLIQ